MDFGFATIEIKPNFLIRKKTWVITTVKIPS